MKNFKTIRENNEMMARLSAKNKLFKDLIIKDIESDSIDEIKNILELNKKSLESNGQVTLKSFQDLDDKIKFSIEHDELLDNILKDTDWFTKTPSQMNLNNIKSWLAKAVDICLLEVINNILTELQ